MCTFTGTHEAPARRAAGTAAGTLRGAAVGRYDLYGEGNLPQILNKTQFQYQAYRQQEFHRICYPDAFASIFRLSLKVAATAKT